MTHIKQESRVSSTDEESKLLKKNGNKETLRTGLFPFFE